MADDNWKKRVGIEINFSSDEDEVGGVTKYTDDLSNQLSPPTFHDSPESSLEGQRFFGDEILNEYAEYGSTPPRTRISRRLREHKQRIGAMSSTTKSAPKVIHAKATRRNTLDSLYFSELLERSDLSSPHHQAGSVVEPSLRPETLKRSNSKRTMKLLRGAERDLKLDIPIATRQNGTSVDVVDDRAESLPAMVPQQAIKVETCNRFLSLTSKLVACRAFKRSERNDKEPTDCSQSRHDFYNTFSLLIRMGSGEKQSEKNPRRMLSREEHLWQNELKDLIWLELQAWHAGRTLTEQDAYLCKAREEIEPLLTDIMEYKFVRRKPGLMTPTTPSARSQDSGFSPELMDDTEILCCAAKIATSCSNQTCTTHHNTTASCDGCLSMYCHDCNDAQESALKEIEALLNRLEAAEALYPSSKGFSVQYPLYKSGGFVGRVKAMCLWYNMTKHNRLKLRILGKLLMLSVFQVKRYQWPTFVDEDNSSGIGSGTPNSDITQPDMMNVSRSSSVEDKQLSKVGSKRLVQFDVDSSSPSDSNNSNASHGTTSSEAEVSDRLRELYNFKSLSNPGPAIFNRNSAKNPYRKYIEDVLKTRGLRKALAFLESLHTRVLLKSLITLEKPLERNGNESGGVDKLTESTDSTIEGSLTNDFKSINESESEEMRRYGFWSPETKALSLPSYRSAFLFLSRIPLDVIHEFLCMRLEQKPDSPSVLSIRQLMRELKEGLGIAVLHRERYLQLIRTVLWDVDSATLEQFEDGVTEFDKSVKSVLEVYLDYLQQWVQMVQQESFKKHLLEEEWTFVKATCPHISDGEALAGNSFCRMAIGMLASVGEYLHSSVEQLGHNMHMCDQCDEDSSPRQCMLSVCRDLQGVLNVARVRALRAVCFAKMLRKDLDVDRAEQNLVPLDPSVAESVRELKLEALVLSYSISQSIRDIDRTCDCPDLCGEFEETDRAAILGRNREVLHLAFKFGFEYHKEVCRLVTGELREKLSRGLIAFAKLWMTFVKERCERGRGLRPRWASQGLDFLMTICEPHHTSFLSDAEFEALKSAMDQCISHVIGQPPATPEKPPSPMPPSPRSSIDHSRSPLPIRARLRCSKSLQGHRRTPSGNIVIDDGSDGNIVETLNVPLLALTREDRVKAAVASLDEEIDDRLRDRDLIGSVTDIECEDKIHIRLRSVTFGWQRGIKIGQGSYGKVYTAVNNQTGELMAMKEIQLQPNDHRTIRRVAEELRIFEGIKHRHLVRYYGVEIHREEMLIFMEFCAEGTLESLVAGTENGLPEALVRRYTRQLLNAMATLHRHGVVHRDVKSANIFLTDEGNCLKLGDFGSAVKIKAHTTLPGELQGFVGTQAYMAPEVFMKTTSEGHGRAADVWSIGCVVVEMASGERPWAEFDSNYQIMFKVGMGETPSVPDSLSEEGADFLGLCLQHDPRHRATAEALLQHTFSKVDGDEESVLSLPM